ncbi:MULTISPECIES: DJ-1/PfpI family protein [unclassified Pseudonocardia]|uniref:DJ-1/PfpI family protein n=1 Tax=unclassified Pseudonocardia TaxID=2619320 RepID=UPI0025FD35FE|nr:MULTISPECIES: DJ-1/PfpI family protein [unclassified Pseudonocardia]
MTHHVVMPIFEGIQPLDAVGPHEVFATASALVSGPGYRMTTVAAAPGAVRATSGLQLVADTALPESGTIDTLLVPGGAGARRIAHDAEFVGWLRRAAVRAGRVASVCTGAFPLAATGLLDDLAATTHWRYAAELAREFPAVDVRPDSIHLRQAGSGAPRASRRASTWRSPSSRPTTTPPPPSSWPASSWSCYAGREGRASSPGLRWVSSRHPGRPSARRRTSSTPTPPPTCAFPYSPPPSA